MAPVPGRPDVVRLLIEAPFEEVTIDGLVPGGVVEPETAEEAAALLAESVRRGFACAPVGGGTKLALGNPPERLDVVLSTRRLGGVIDYVPTDLVLSVGAGARNGDVRAVLAEHGQHLPIDAPAEATIGGLIATALAGPRRLGYGTLRDLLIGIAVAHPVGTVTRAGGMVVKNVSGFDLPRVYHGSLGTLGVIVSANFKVLPAPRHETTLLVDFDALPDALAAAGRIRGSSLRPTALEVTNSGGAWGLAVRLDGRPDTLTGSADEARRLSVADARTIEGGESAAWWDDYLAAQDLRLGPGEALLRASVRPRDTATLVEGAVTAFSRIGLGLPPIFASPALGSLVVKIRPGGNEPAAMLAETLGLLGALADHASVLAAPVAWKHGIDVWGKAPETLDLMRALKTQFDPARVLNPGRFVGFI
ncbi:MAG TPA: FAD-binding oxidoreductase [Thermomicrobiales bacterium]|nr:FAD-binding oxidoreductase [Thermomicrobiales bacterium]